MKKCYLILTLMLMLSLLPLQPSLADEPLDGLLLPATAEETQFAAEQQQAIAALLAQQPGAVVDYAVRDLDDGRYEWDLFFTLNGQLGECEVLEDGFAVRRTVLYDKPSDGLTASQAMAALAQAKGDVAILDLELDREGSRLTYEGEALLNGKYYEFELNVNGSIIEWERD